MLAVIAICLILIVAKVYKVEVPATAQAGPSAAAMYKAGLPQQVTLVYYPNGSSFTRPVVGDDGKLPTK